MRSSEAERFRLTLAVTGAEVFVAVKALAWRTSQLRRFTRFARTSFMSRKE